MPRVGKGLKVLARLRVNELSFKRKRFKTALSNNFRESIIFSSQHFNIYICFLPGPNFIDNVIVLCTGLWNLNIIQNA
jgi:hypothetical protein